MIFLLIACNHATVAPLGEEHLLLTGQAPYKDQQLAGVWEADTDFNEVWRQPLSKDQGGFGAQRVEEGTLISYSGPPPDPNTGFSLVNQDGERLWAYDASEAGALVFPHGVGVTPWGQYLVADAVTSRIMAVGADGKVDWIQYTAADQKGPSGFDIGMVDGQPMLIATLLDESTTSSDTDDQVYAWWLHEDGLELAWKWPESMDLRIASWMHGAHFQRDGSLLVSVAGLGNIVELDPATGRELRRAPSDDRTVLAFPRDAVLLGNGDMIVVDAVELLRVRDPFGDFEIVDSIPAPLSYSVELLDCASEVCYE